MKKTLTLIFVLMIFVPLLAFSQQTQSQTSPATTMTAAGVYDSLAKGVEAKIKNQKKVKIDGLKVTHADETVYLEGIANVYGSYFTAEKVASQYSGVKKVVNNIGVRKSNLADGDIALNVVQKVQGILPSDPFNLLQVRVKDGTVYLLGYVVDTSLPEKARNEAMWINGVQNVVDKVQLASISSQDERLRNAIYQVFRAEYPQYFQGAHPSVVILVDAGRVTLIGSINTEADKRRMVSSIRSVPGVLSVNGDQLALPQ